MKNKKIFSAHPAGFTNEIGQFRHSLRRNSMPTGKVGLSTFVKKLLIACFQRFLFRLSCSMFLLFCVVCPYGAQAQAVSSQNLIEKACVYDGQIVSYQGELIGAVLGRGAHVWLNLNDGNNAIGAWVERFLTKNIKFAGSYMVRGDVVLVRGIFHRSCDEHGGGMDIHVSELNIVTPGGPLAQGVAGYKIILLIVLLGVLACLLTAHILLKKLRRP